jgi:uncharacterized membrane protein YeaQ/YmgE (transglycosylase-associated protein family)
MPERFLITPTDIVAWAVIGLIGGLVGGLACRGGRIKLSDAIFGVPGALLGGVLVELTGMRSESTERVAELAAAFFAALILTVVVRMIPGRFAA